METQASDPVDRRLRGTERTIPVPPMRDTGCLPGAGVSDCGGGSVSAHVGRFFRIRLKGPVPW